MLFGHNAWDAATTNVRSAEPDLTKVVDYPGQDYFTRFSVTDLGITPENTLLGKYDKGFHFTVAPERQVEVRISGPDDHDDGTTADVDDDVDDAADDGSETGTDTTGETTGQTSASKFPTKLAAIGGIVVIGGLAATKMRKRGV